MALQRTWHKIQVSANIFGHVHSGSVKFEKFSRHEREDFQFRNLKLSWDQSSSMFSRESGEDNFTPSSTFSLITSALLLPLSLFTLLIQNGSQLIKSNGWVNSYWSQVLSPSYDESDSIQLNCLATRRCGFSCWDLTQPGKQVSLGLATCLGWPLTSADTAILYKLKLNQSVTTVPTGRFALPFI